MLSSTRFEAAGRNIRCVKWPLAHAVGEGRDPSRQRCEDEGSFNRPHPASASHSPTSPASGNSCKTSSPSRLAALAPQEEEGLGDLILTREGVLSLPPVLIRRGAAP